MRILFILFLSILLSNALYAQFGKEPNKYSLGKLTQERVSKSKQLTASGVKESKDTTFTTYINGSIPMRLFSINAKSKEASSNTGIYLNNQRFSFYCDVEKAFRQSTGNFLDIYEFSYLGKKYVCLVSMRDDCIDKACDFKCYNLFDITNPKRIEQIAFSSIFNGTDSFGDFNFDGMIDFARVVPKDPDNRTKGLKTEGNTYTITAYSIGLGSVAQLKKSKDAGAGQAHYIFAQGDKDANEFEVIQHDWMIPLKGKTGEVVTTVESKEPIIPFDPKEAVLYNMEGEKVDKSNWGLEIFKFEDIEGALKFCEELRSRRFEGVYLMPDQYNKRIYYYVYVGNYLDKSEGASDQIKLKKIGLNSSFRDFKARYSTSD
ncbi:MAG: SPOR domain-containing protein [Thermoflexibacter sp.]|jgi:hypothetical protein|nr:SPOR domain-containing protein [Thermoflexibacter sp.]